MNKRGVQATKIGWRAGVRSSSVGRRKDTAQSTDENVIPAYMEIHE